MSVPVDVTLRVRVQSDIDPRYERGAVPYDFKHLNSTPEVEAFLDHLAAKARQEIEAAGGIVVVEFEILQEEA